MVTLAQRVLFVIIIAAVTSTSSAAPVPTPEQALSAAIHARDLQGVSPGGWWDDQPEFNDRLDPAFGKGLDFYVIAHTFGKPDSDPSDVDTAVDVFANAAAAAADFAALAWTDAKNLGTPGSGPAVGTRSRYMHTGSASTVRFQSGRYLVRVTVSGKSSPAGTQTLASLAGVVIGRLSRLTAGTLPAAALPKLAQSLPAANSTFGPILGTSSANGSWWIWTMRGSDYVISPSLRNLVRDAEPGVYRRYKLAAHPDNVVDVTIMPFANDAAAARYFAQSRKQNGRSAVPDTAIAVTGPHGADMGYSAEFRQGRYGIGVNCSSPFARVAPSCAQAVRAMAQRITLPKER